MGKPDLYPLSGETRALLKRQGDFFRAVADLHAETQVNLRGTDSEAVVERLEENGEIHVSFVYPLDDNADPADGRIYLRDRFTFGAAGEEFRTYTRSFEYAGRDAAWAARAQRFRDFPTPSPTAVTTFSQELARRYAGPSPWLGFDPQQIQALKAGQTYLLPAAELAAEVIPNGRLKIGDPQTHYTVEQAGDRTVLTLSFVVDDDAAIGNGRIWLEERFSLDAETRELKEFSRKWRVNPDSAAAQNWQEMAKRLNQGPQPDEASARTFLQGILPSLALPPPEHRFGPSPFSALSAARTKSRATQRLATLETVDFLEQVTADALEKKIDESKGWLSGRTLDGAELRALAAKIFLQAKQAAQENGGAKNAAAVLKSLSLTEEEAALRDAWLENPLWKKILAAGTEENEAFRSDQFLHIARHDLLPLGFLAAARYAAVRYEAGPSAEQAKSLAATLAGTAGFGESLESFGVQAGKSLASPTSLAAMVVAGTAGPAVELAGLRALGRFGSWGRFGAASLGTAFEATAFTTLHKTGEALFHDPERVFAQWDRDVASTALLFGSMRLAHAGAASLSARAAESAWAQRAGLSRSLGEGETGSLLATAHERLLLRSPQAAFTGPGKWVHGAAGHLSGMTGLLAAGAVSRRLGWQEEGPQPFGLAGDTLLFYLQASLGYHLANRLTGGEWLRALGEIKLRQNLLPARKVDFDFLSPKIRKGGRQRLPTAQLFDVGLMALNLPSSEGGAFRLEPNHPVFIDRFLSGRRERNVKLTVNDLGNPYLLDGRKPSRLPRALQRALGRADDHAVPLLVNGAPVPRNEWLLLEDSDLVSFSNRHFGLGAMYQAPLKQSFFALPPPASDALMEIFSRSTTLSDLVQNLKTSSAPLAAELFQHMISILQGKQPLQTLPVRLVSRIKDLLANEVREANLAGHPLETSRLKNESHNFRWSPLESHYHLARAMTSLAFQIRQAASLQDIREALFRNNLGMIAGIKTEDLAEKILRIEQRRENGLQELPAYLGVRQRVRDLLEQKVYRDFILNINSIPRIPAAPDARSRLAFNALGMQRAQLYRKLDQAAEFHTPDKIYHRGEIKEMLDQVLERGKPLVVLPEAYGFRREAEAYLQSVEQAMSELFPFDMSATVNPFSGELIYEAFRESKYRLALHVYHYHSGKPIHGAPTIREIERLGNLVQTYLGADESDFVLDQAQLRHHLDHATPQALRMLRQATPADKALIIDTYFGSYRRRDVTAATAFQLAILLGESGVYREVGVTYEIDGGSLRPTLSLGDLHFVSPQRLGDFFAVHTHPEEYVTAEGQIMGVGQNGGGPNDTQQKTMILDGGNYRVSSDTRSILPSDQDIHIFLNDAQRYWQAGYPEKFGNTPIFETGGRTYKNWVFNSWGSSEVRIELNAAGIPAGVKILYAFKGEVDVSDGNYRNSIQRLTNLAQNLNLPIQFEAIGYRELRRRLPFEIPLASGYHLHFKKGPRSYTVGRNPQFADGVILDQAISEVHLEFAHTDQGWVVADVGSSNGTRLGNTLISKAKGHRGHWYPLVDGDLLSIGRLKLQFNRDEFNEGMNLTQIVD